MKIGNNFFGLKASAYGLGVQRKKMNLVAENIANQSTTKTDDGTPYERKFLVVKQNKQTSFQAALNGTADNSTLELKSDNPFHIQMPIQNENKPQPYNDTLKGEVKNDKSEGDLVYMPEHPDANEDGYVQMPNVNIVNEMVDMIAASRSYEANLTAFNSSKQMAKDTLEI
jgi:flagellar basal-body rod protein FlgC